MISVDFNEKSFAKQLNNMVEYSMGFLDGVQRGKTQMLKTVGLSAIEVLKSYIDSQARIDPGLLHHVYEWNQTGSPDGRLFDISYTVSGLGLSFKSTFSQSKSIKEGSTVPFYDKARIMENGIPVQIKPKNNVLAFNINGEDIFTSKPIDVKNPGGPDVEGSFERVFDSFFNNYFSQSFLRVSGILDYLQDPTVYKKNLNAGKKAGRSLGITTGYRWIANVGVEK
jgi:hypothetical protein